MKRKIPLLLLCLLFLGIFLYSGIRILGILREYRVGKQTYEALTEFVQIPETTQPASETTRPDKKEKPSTALLPEQTQPAEEEIIWPVVDFEGLQDINPDVAAWIYVEGTPINYPVVRGEDNDEYLYQLFDGTYNSSGSIFMDYRNERDFSDRHTILYGHHMSGDGMFAWVNEYVAQDFSKEHPTCLLLTPEANYTLEFFAGYVDDTDSDAWRLNFSSDEAYGLWLEQSIEKSTFTGSVIPTSQERVVTFSTCAYDFEDARCVLLGVLKPQH